MSKMYLERVALESWLRSLRSVRLRRLLGFRDGSHHARFPLLFRLFERE